MFSPKQQSDFSLCKLLLLCGLGSPQRGWWEVVFPWTTKKMRLQAVNWELGLATVEEAKSLLGNYGQVDSLSAFLFLPLLDLYWPQFRKESLFGKALTGLNVNVSVRSWTGPGQAAALHVQESGGTFSTDDHGLVPGRKLQLGSDQVEIFCFVGLFKINELMKINCVDFFSMKSIYCVELFSMKSIYLFWN